MATPSAQFSLTLRVELPPERGALGKVTAAINRSGGAIVAVDTVESGGGGPRREGGRGHRPPLRRPPPGQDPHRAEPAAEEPRRPLDGLHAGRRARLQRD